MGKPLARQVINFRQRANLSSKRRVLLRDFVYVTTACPKKVTLSRPRKTWLVSARRQHVDTSLTAHSKVASLSITLTNPKKENKSVLSHIRRFLYDDPFLVNTSLLLWVCGVKGGEGGERIKLRFVNFFYFFAYYIANIYPARVTSFCKWRSQI